MPNERIYKLLRLVLAACAVVYVVLRIFNIPVTCDEGWTLFAYVDNPLWDALTAKAPAANNHIFNTVLTKLTTSISRHEFFLRLPNLLALFLYLYSINSLSKRLFSNRFAQLLVFIVLTFNYTLLAFFGLCRGYGLSIGLLMFSIAHLVQAVQKKQYGNTINIHLCLLSGILAIYSNYTVLHAVTAVFIVVIYLQYKGKEKVGLLKRYSLPLLYGGLGLLLFGYPFYNTFSSGEMYYGGEKNMIDDTLVAILSDWLGDGFVRAWKDPAIIIVLVLLVLSTVLYLLHRKRGNKSSLATPMFILLYCIVVINILFYTIGVRLPIDRTSMHLFPLMILYIFSSAEFSRGIIKKAVVFVLLLVTGLSAYRFTEVMNISSINLWWTDMYTRQVLKDIDKYYAPANSKDKIKMFTFWPCDNSFNYYITTRYRDKFDNVPCCIHFKELEHIDQYDYLYIYKYEDMSAYPNFKRLKAYHPDSVFVLYQNTNNTPVHN